MKDFKNKIPTSGRELAMNLLQPHGHLEKQESQLLYQWRLAISDEILFNFAYCIEKINDSFCLVIQMFYEGHTHFKIQTVTFHAFDFIKFMKGNWPHCGLYVHNLDEIPQNFKKCEGEHDSLQDVGSRLKKILRTP